MGWELFDPQKDKRFGPFSEEEVLDQIKRDLRPEVMCRTEGEQGWRPLFSHDAFRSAFVNERGILDPAGSERATKRSTREHDPGPRKPAKRRSTIPLVAGAAVVVFAAVAWMQYDRDASNTGSETTLTGALTKEGARRLIEQRQQALRDGRTALCRFRPAVIRNDTTGELRFSGYDDDVPSEACLDSMKSVGMIEKYSCETNQRWEGYLECRLQPGTSGPPARISNGIYLSFDCGTQSVGQVLAIYTKDNRATVQYSIERNLKQDLLSSLSACPVDVPQAREPKESSAFRRSDDSSWSIEPRETLGF
jgi:hypothetical protein